MDNTDFRILGALLAQPTAAKTALARKLELSHTAVSKRLARLEEDGVLQGFVALPSASVFGREPRLHIFENLEDPRRASREAVAVEPVVWASAKHGSRLTVLGYHEPDGPPDVGKLEGAVGGRCLASLAMPTYASEGRPEDLSPLDWRVMRAVVEQPRAPATELAKRTGLTRKTVTHRRNALLRQGHLRIEPNIATPEEPGVLLFHLSLSVPSHEAAARIRSACKDRCITRGVVDDPPGLYLFCHAGSLRELRELEGWLLEEGLATAVEVDLPVELAVAEARVLGWVQAWIARWQDAAGR